MSGGRLSGFLRVTSTAIESDSQPRRLSWSARGFWQVTIALDLGVSGCSHAPTMDLLGSYFPAWMLCAAIGILTAVVIRQILAAAGINDYVVAPLLTYAGLAVSATLLAWLLWFGH
jgi:hypothetical protein